MKTFCSDIKQMADGTEVGSCFVVTTREAPKQTRTGNYYLRVVIADKSGEIDLMYWGGNNLEPVKRVFDSFAIGNVVYVSGKVNTFRGKKNIIIDETFGEIRLANEGEYDLDDFLHKTNQDIESMWGYITGIIDSINDPHLKALLNAFFKNEEFVKQFKTIPAARYYHHACIGGLLEHTWEVLNYCEKAIEIHPSLDKDLLFTGAILHDLGKIRENEISIGINQTREGMLLGHIYIGAEMVKDKISTISGFPQLLSDRIIHIILSHHGKEEYGAFLTPQFPEAVTVSCADDIGSKVTQYIRAKKDAKTDDFKTYIKHLGWVFLE